MVWFKECETTNEKMELIQGIIFASGITTSAVLAALVIKFTNERREQYLKIKKR